MNIRHTPASLIASAPGAAVVPIDWTMFTSTPPADADSQRARTILLNANRYSLTHWYQVRRAWQCARAGDDPP